jgi:hypothetical protein
MCSSNSDTFWALKRLGYKLFDKENAKYFRNLSMKIRVLGTEEKFKNKMIHYTYWRIFKEK